MTTTATLLIYSRCPHVVDKATGRRCDHPANHTLPGKDVLHVYVEEMRHSIQCEDDRGHTWSIVWGTDQPLT